ncbi:MAG TPA: hypothetical protein VLQ65_14660 [Saliniramus sp.]|nr:hypothetical protein [Saliniramus sp.]
MRKFITGLAAAVVLALSALTLTPQTASAQGFSITFGTGQPPMVRHYDDRRRVAPVPRYDPRHVDRRQFDRRHDDRRNWDRGHDRRSYRHAPRPRYAQDCTVRVERFWDGYRWVSERRRICR